MDTNLNIGRIYLGKSTAEYEIEKLHNYFISTSAYLNAKDVERRRMMYLGNRGAGKSALFGQLIFELKKNKGNIVVSVCPTDYSYDTFRSMEHDFYDVRVAYSIAWEYTLLVQLFNAVVEYFEENPNVKTNRNNYKEIRDYLEKNGLLMEKNRLSIFLGYLRKVALSRIKIKISDFEVEGGLSERHDELTGILKINDIRSAERAMRVITATHPIHIFIDELDTGWNNTNEAKNYISGLLSAAKKINAIEGVFVYISLRQDMYDNLQDLLKDMEKMKDDIERLSWDRSLLKALICRRIKSNKEYKEKVDCEINNDDVIGLIFEPGVFDVILSHTLQRPRELIYLCNNMIEAYSETGDDDGKPNKRIGIKYFQDMKYQTSEYRLNELCNEYEYEMPGLKEFVSVFEGNRIEYYYKDFVEMVEIAVLNLVEKNPTYCWTDDLLNKPFEIVKKLHKIGFIKICVSSAKQYFAAYEHSPVSYNNIYFVRINDVFISGLECSDES